jgi:hypothetical protein
MALLRREWLQVGSYWCLSSPKFFLYCIERGATTNVSTIMWCESERTFPAKLYTFATKHKTTKSPLIEFFIETTKIQLTPIDCVSLLRADLYKSYDVNWNIIIVRFWDQKTHSKIFSEGKFLAKLNVVANIGLLLRIYLNTHEIIVDPISAFHKTKFHETFMSLKLLLAPFHTSV